MLLLLLLVAGVTNTLAQNVTIKATNGSMVASMPKTGYGALEDMGYKSGGFATWQHEQLSMVLTTSDHTDKTPSGQLDNPANNIYSDGEHLQIVKGSGRGYVSLSLPKGYRFTSYTIKFSKPGALTKGPENDASSQQSFNQGNRSSTFGETDSNFSSYIESATVQRGGAAQSISRTETENNKMSNVLYFVLGPDNDYFELITLESAEFFFTAEENYSPVTPAGVISSAVSAVDVAFSTSRVDYGTIGSTQYFGHSRITYDSDKVHDLNAYLTLFQENAVKDGVDIDGVTGKKVVDYDRTDGTITSEAGYFKLSSPSNEQVYYIESPSHVTVSDGTKVPVGYRIIGAELEYAKKIANSRTFYITYTYNGTKYYLYTNGYGVTWETRNNRRTQWTMDADGYIRGNNYYLIFNQARAGIQRQKPAESERYVLGDDGIYQKGWPEYYVRFGVQEYYGYETYFALVSKDTGYNANYEIVSESTTGTGTTDFTLTIYNADGSKKEDITVNDANPNGTYSLKGLNNDAIKFGVKGIGLVRATLTLQALDPYLNSMRVVCEDQTIKSIRPSQVFTANDFSVSGGEFFFHMPESSKDHNVLISFEDLKSKYFDETYTGGSSEHTSRLNFVRSAHYDAFGTSNNSVYNNTSEAANATKERQKVTTVGTAPFKFNNADEVGENGGTLTEFPFSLENYSDEGGDFTQIGFKVEEGQTKTGTAYVFTTDETRYNISPATAVQHRAYAFYKMIVHVSLATYTEQIAFEKIYDKTLYRDNEGKTQTGAFYGVKVTAPYTEDGKTKQGYAATDKVFTLISNAITAGGDDVPEDSKHILYIDFSNLEGVYQTTTTDNPDMETYANSNAANCLFFLPVGASAPNNNTAYKSEEGSIFYAANNIVLTDMQPFYSPYEIHMEGKTNKVEYTRQVTYDKYGKPKNASLILPFKITLTDGTHTNTDGTSFTVHTLQANNAFIKMGDSNYAYAPIMTGVNEAEANKPYIIVIEGTAEGKDVFKISQEGGVVAATTGMGSDYTFTGHSASGTENVTMKGSYAGQQIEKTKNIYYFANNEFVNSKDYVYDKVNSAPFRAYFVPNSNGAKLASFGLIFSEGIGDDPTGISSVDKNPDLMVIPGSGVITMTSTKEQNVRVHSTSGVMVNNTKLQAGETQTIQVPAGVYVINGVKIIVK